MYNRALKQEFLKETYGLNIQRVKYTVRLRTVALRHAFTATERLLRHFQTVIDPVM